VIDMKNRLHPVEEWQTFSSKRGVTVASHNEISRQADFWIDHPKEQREAARLLYREHTNERSVRAILLAEPKGAYDAAYDKKPKKRRAELLRAQIDQSAEITMRLGEYIEKNAMRLWDLPAEETFSDLSRVAFYTNDLEEQEQHYAQSQRRGFKLAIANFIGDREQLRPHRERFVKDPKNAVEELFHKNIDYIPKVEFLPIGVIIWVKESDFNAFRQTESEQMNSTHGATIHNATLPNEFQGRVVLINTGTQEKPNSAAEMSVTRRHEIKHMVFSSFHATEPNAMPPERVRRWLPQLRSVMEHRKYMRVWKESYANEAQDEVIAYASHGNLEVDIFSLGLQRMLGDLGLIGEDMGMESAVYEEYTETCRQLLRELREYQYVTKMLYTATQKPHTLLSREKVEALLQNTPFQKIDRLSHYVNIQAESIGRRVQQESVLRIDLFAQELARHERNPERNISPLIECLYALDAYYPKEVLPLLQRCVELCPTSVYAQVEELVHVVAMAYDRKEMTDQEVSALDQLNETLTSPESLMRMVFEAEQSFDDQRCAWLLDFVHAHTGRHFFEKRPDVAVQLGDLLEPILQKDIKRFPISRSRAEAIQKNISIALTKKRIQEA